MNYYIEEGEQRLDTNSLVGLSITKVVPREFIYWRYDEEEDVPYASVGVDYELDEKGLSVHLVDFYYKNGKFLINTMTFFYDTGWNHFEFAFTAEEIEQDPELSRIAKSVLEKSKLLMITGLDLSPPIFCEKCHEPISKGPQARNHDQRSCLQIRVRKKYLYGGNQFYSDQLTFEEAENMVRDALSVKETLHAVMNYPSITPRQIQNIERLLARKE